MKNSIGEGMVKGYRFRIKEKLVRHYDTERIYYVLDYFSWRKLADNLFRLAITVFIANILGWILRLPALVIIIYCTSIVFIFLTKRNLAWVHISSFDNMDSAIEEVVRIKQCQSRPKLKPCKQWFLQPYKNKTQGDFYGHTSLVSQSTRLH